MEGDADSTRGVIDYDPSGSSDEHDRSGETQMIMSGREPVKFASPKLPGTRREIVFRDRPPRTVGYPGFDTSMSFVCSDEIDVRTDVHWRWNESEILECAAVVVQTCRNYCLLSTPIRQVGTIMVSHRQWSIPPPAELPPFGTWWRLHVVPLAYRQGCKHKLQRDVTHVAINMIDYIPPEIHPLNGQMRGFAGLIEIWLQIDLSVTGCVDKFFYDVGVNDFYYLVNTNQHGLQVEIPYDRLQHIIEGPRVTRDVTIAFWAMLTMSGSEMNWNIERPVNELPVKLKLQNNTDLYAVLPSGLLFQIISFDDPEEWWRQFEIRAEEDGSGDDFD
ncbi:hypothetical protein WR25_06228 [Diploscapter pachys]|uniref:Uncharacterized protein n=1 Tax=Diploscapter pachys TaxID=2018661 RepID=A0A2A2M0J3_9BILA|nr:hypothetical protein WR25_06228 [Diploscapter pachys]